MQFDHIGLITEKKQDKEIWVEKTRVWVTDYKNHPYRVEWLRFEKDSPVKGAVREKSHVAYRVKSLKAASGGLKVLLEPFDVGFAVVGFYDSGDGAVIDYQQQFKNLPITMVWNFTRDYILFYLKSCKRLYFILKILK